MGVASWYDRHVMPRLITFACGQRGIEERRGTIVPLARGKVFELGCGAGLNLPLYDRDRVTAMSGIDPHERLLESAREKARLLARDVDFRPGFGEEIPFSGGSFDTVVCTYTLCSVQDHAQVLAELHRVLKPDGQLLFLEHGRAPDQRVADWQERIEPIWKPLAGGCHLTRAVGGSLRAGGFEVEPLGQGYLEKAPRVAGWMEWGIARKRGQ